MDQSYFRIWKCFTLSIVFDVKKGVDIVDYTTIIITIYTSGITSGISSG